MQTPAQSAPLNPLAIASNQAPPHSTASRLDYLDATRAFALVLGVAFHASMSFLPFFAGWAVQGPGFSSPPTVEPARNGQTDARMRARNDE